MELTEKILKNFTISKPQRKFLIALFTAVLTSRGKINFRNLSRYSDVSERTYSRQFSNPFEFVAFNRGVIDEGFGRASDRIIVLDASFVSKSGKETYGLDYFWNGCHRRSEKGLEVSGVAIVDVEKKQVLHCRCVKPNLRIHASRLILNPHKKPPRPTK